MEQQIITIAVSLLLGLVLGFVYILADKSRVGRKLLEAANAKKIEQVAMNLYTNRSIVDTVNQYIEEAAKEYNDCEDTNRAPTWIYLSVAEKLAAYLSTIIHKSNSQITYETLSAAEQKIGEEVNFNENVDLLNDVSELANQILTRLGFTPDYLVSQVMKKMKKGENQNG